MGQTAELHVCVVNFEPCMNVLHCIMSVTYNFKNMLLCREAHIIKYSILVCNM